MDESVRLATEVAYRILKSRERNISQSSQLFTDLVEMVRGRIRGESLFLEAGEKAFLSLHQQRFRVVG
jgi:hypothetical protein